MDDAAHPLLLLQRIDMRCVLGWCDHRPRCENADRRFREAFERACRYSGGDRQVATDGLSDALVKLDTLITNRGDEGPLDYPEGVAWNLLMRAIRDIQRGQRRRREVPHEASFFTEHLQESEVPVGRDDELLPRCRRELTRRLYEELVACPRHPKKCPHPVQVVAFALGLLVLEMELVESEAEIARGTARVRQGRALQLSVPSLCRRAGRYSDAQRAAMTRLRSCSRALLADVRRTGGGSA